MKGKANDPENHMLLLRVTSNHQKLLIDLAPAPLNLLLTPTCSPSLAVVNVNVAAV
jgi:hypothetical protein